MGSSSSREEVPPVSPYPKRKRAQISYAELESDEEAITSSNRVDVVPRAPKVFRFSMYLPVDSLPSNITLAIEEIEEIDQAKT